MAKKIYQIYEIGKEMPKEDESVEIDLKRHAFKSELVEDIPHGLGAVEEAIWILKNKKK